MSTLFLILLSTSLVALVVLVPMVIIDMLKKKKSNTLYRSTVITILVTFISIMGFIFTIEETKISDQTEKVESEIQEEPKKATPAINMVNANDTSLPLGERIKKIAEDLFGDTTVQGTERNITIDNIGELYYLNLMIDDGITKKNTLALAQRHTVELLKVLQSVDDFKQININWQGNFKDSIGNSNVGSAMNVMVKKENIKNVNFDEFDANKLKEIAVNYGVHNDFK